MKNSIMFLTVISAILLSACHTGSGREDPDKPGGQVTKVVQITSDLCWNIQTDLAMYAPGATIRFKADGTPTDNTFVRYRNGSRVVAESL